MQVGIPKMDVLTVHVCRLSPSAVSVVVIICNWHLSWKEFNLELVLCTVADGVALEHPVCLELTFARHNVTATYKEVVWKPIILQRALFL